MALPKTVGFPRMMHESGEKRVFLPEFVQFVERLGLSVHLEEDYGSRSGLTLDDFRKGSASIRSCARGEAFRQDLVIVLRCPRSAEFELLRPGACLISMLHFPTRPKRIETLQRLGVGAVALDCVTDDTGARLVENMRAVAWNGLEAAFDILERRPPRSGRRPGKPERVLVLGTGMVGRHAVDAATKTGNVERNNRRIAQGAPGVVVVSVGRNLSGDAAGMERLFRETDILVDATQRRDASRAVVPNGWIRWLPEHAVVTDLAVDPYTLDTSPPVVRGLEGMPQGDLDKYVFHPGDPDWDRTVPTSIPSRHRRTVVSCYSWPGIHAKECMSHYGRQLTPLLEALARRGYDGLSPNGGIFERAMCRGTLRHWLRANRRDSR